MLIPRTFKHPFLVIIHIFHRKSHPKSDMKITILYRTKGKCSFMSMKLRTIVAVSRWTMTNKKDILENYYIATF